VFRLESVPRAETTADYLGRPSFGERVFGAALVDG
jgi:hypothetical protein